MKSINIKGKEYIEVNERVKEFRKLYENKYGIPTEIKYLDMEQGYVVIQANIVDNETGKILSTGTAYELKDSSFINKTSFIENCETSAVGRALGFLGIGIDTSIASAEEVENAILQQDTNAKVTDTEARTIYALIQKNGRDLNKFLEYFKVSNTNELTKAQYVEALKMIKGDK